MDFGMNKRIQIIWMWEGKKPRRGCERGKPHKKPYGTTYTNTHQTYLRFSFGFARLVSIILFGNSLLIEVCDLLSMKHIVFFLSRSLHNIKNKMLKNIFVTLSRKNRPAYLWVDQFYVQIIFTLSPNFLWLINFAFVV